MLFTKTPTTEKLTRKQWVNVLLFLSAPFIGLLYAMLLPFVGLGMLTWYGVKQLRDRRNAAAVPVAPVVV
jgi:hypothetical protein